MDNFILNQHDRTILNTDMITCIIKHDLYATCNQHIIIMNKETIKREDYGSFPRLDSKALSLLPNNFCLIDEEKYGMINNVYVNEKHRYFPQWYRKQCWINLNHVETIKEEENYLLIDDPYTNIKIYRIILSNIMLTTTVEPEKFLPVKLNERIESQKIMYKLMQY